MHWSAELQTKVYDPRIERANLCSLNHKDKDGMFTIAVESVGQKNNSESRTGIEPMDPQIPVGIGHFRILGIGLELACNGGYCG